MIPDWIVQFNSIAWVFTNVLVAYIALVLVIFVAGYWILFDPRATTAGKFVFRFALSLVGIIGLVYIGLFIDPSQGRQWFVYPGDVIWWRPIVRLIAYGYVAYTVTGLAILLGFRKWAPHKLRTILDRDVIKVRQLGLNTREGETIDDSGRTKES